MDGHVGEALAQRPHEQLRGTRLEQASHVLEEGEGGGQCEVAAPTEGRYTPVIPAVLSLR